MEIRIYVANLHAYNCGALIGEWIDLPCYDLDERLQAIVDAYPESEELAIHDYEAPFKISEYDSISRLNELAEELEDVDEELFEAIEEATGYDAEQILEIINDGSYSAYYGVDDLSDVAAEMVDEGLFGDIPDSLQGYIDYEAIGRDLRIDGWEIVHKHRMAVRVDD